jgi:hypothetical protein
VTGFSMVDHPLLEGGQVNGEITILAPATRRNS